MNIDWSKAPEGTTHFGPETSSYCAAWYRVDEDEVVSYLELDSTDSELKPAIHGSAYYHSLEDLERPWNGEGLPPVGTVCEFAGFNPEETTFDDPSVGDTVTVIAHYLSGCVQVAAFTYNCAANFGALNVAQGAHGCFRPIRTAEQIAAEERDRAINEMVFGACSCEPDGGNTSAFMICGYLYDAGYRKQESSQ
nr:hypothetical protein [uncultured Pseudomonas sp.]